MHRVSKKYIMGFEYFDEVCQEIDYRDNQGFLWKADFAKFFLEQFSDLELVKQKKYKYLNNDCIDCKYLLMKNK